MSETQNSAEAGAEGWNLTWVKAYRLRDAPLSSVSQVARAISRNNRVYGAALSVHWILVPKSWLLASCTATLRFTPLPIAENLNPFAPRGMNFPVVPAMHQLP